MMIKLARSFALFVLFVAVSPIQAQNLVSNGDFESGLADWTIWTTSSGFWDFGWLHTNDCDIWIPTNGCPFDGQTSHAQKKGSFADNNAHGGLYQVINVVPGSTYEVDGHWAGGVRANVDGNNGSWWEIAVYEGIVDDATIDAGLRPEDTLIAKREISNLANNESFEFPWESFSGTFTAQSGVVTLVLKVGSFATFEAAGYHDNISMRGLDSVAVPATSPAWLAALAVLVLLVAGLAFRGR